MTSTTLQLRRLEATKRTKHTYISRLVLGMQSALEELGVEADMMQLENWAIFIHESMSTSSRNYHSVKHVFDISKGWEDPIGILSAYFHDVIYFNVDGGFSKCQAAILDKITVISPVSADEKCTPSCAKQVMRMAEKALDGSDEDELEVLHMVEEIFGMEPSQDLSTMKGLNEFLSAVIAVQLLKAVLDTKRLAEIACCIEATIPFRMDAEDGRSAMDRLFERMCRCNDRFELGMTEEELIKAVQRAALLSNRDLGNFGSTDRTWFLDNTWSLLPETNESLRHQYLYTSAEFQYAVFKMNGFFSFLQPNAIFTSFRGVPSAEEVENLTSEATRNLVIGKKYVQAKLLSISVLAAFAELTGGDAPMSLFMGDLPSRHHVSRRLEDYLPKEAPCLEECDMDVYDLLAKGRGTETSFDIRQSPVAAFLYGSLGDNGMTECLHDLKVYPMKPDTGRELLKRIPRSAILVVAQNMAKVAVSRADLIRDLVMEVHGYDIYNENMIMQQ